MPPTVYYTGPTLSLADAAAAMAAATAAADAANQAETDAAAAMAEALAAMAYAIAHSGGGGSEQVIIVSKTANYAVQNADTGIIFDNNGASGEVDFTLPAWAQTLLYAFTVAVGHTVKVIAAGTNKIAVGPTNSGAGGNVVSSTLFSTIYIYGSSIPGQWIASTMTGTWTVN